MSTTAIGASLAQRRSNSMKRRESIWHAMPYILPHFIIFAIFGIIPIVFGIYLAFTKWNMIGDPQFIGLGNFARIFDPDSYFFSLFWRDLWHTLIFVVISVPLTIIIPLLLAVGLEKKGLKGGGLFQAIFYIPGLISISAGALVWKMMFNPQFGMMNKILGTNIDWLNKNPYAWITIFVLSIWAGIGGNLVIYRSALSGVNQDLYEAARVDGAGPVRIFFSITLPEIKLPLFYTSIMTTTAAFNVWGQPVMLTAGGPAFQTQVLMMDIRDLAFPAGPAAAGMASAMALLLGVILMAIAVVQIIFMNKED